jgi:hypothetical protein
VCIRGVWGFVFVSASNGWMGNWALGHIFLHTWLWGKAVQKVAMQCKAGLANTEREAAHVRTLDSSRQEGAHVRCLTLLAQNLLTQRHTQNHHCTVHQHSLCSGSAWARPHVVVMLLLHARLVCLLQCCCCLCWCCRDCKRAQHGSCRDRRCQASCQQPSPAGGFTLCRIIMVRQRCPAGC